MKMKTKIIAGMAVLALLFGLSLISCSNDDNSGSDAIPEPYRNTTWTYHSTIVKFFTNNCIIENGFDVGGTVNYTTIKVRTFSATDGKDYWEISLTAYEHYSDLGDYYPEVQRSFALRKDGTAIADYTGGGTFNPTLFKKQE